jgi:hypothetical protein
VGSSTSTSSHCYSSCDSYSYYHRTFFLSAEHLSYLDPLAEVGKATETLWEQATPTSSAYSQPTGSSRFSLQEGSRSSSLVEDPSKASAKVTSWPIANGENQERHGAASLGEAGTGCGCLLGTCAYDLLPDEEEGCKRAT